MQNSLKSILSWFVSTEVWRKTIQPCQAKNETLLESCCNFVKQILILFPNFLTSFRLESLTML